MFLSIKGPLSHVKNIFIIIVWLVFVTLLWYFKFGRRNHGSYLV